MSSGTAPAPAPPVVVALGGNAISPARLRDNIDRQFQQTRRTVEVLADLLREEAPVLITHGNGPQIGSALHRNELSAPAVYALPLDVLVADLQGGMGYMIGECIVNELGRRGVRRPVTTVVTTVEVADDDPSFADPSKPIGPFFDADQAPGLRAHGWHVVEIPGQGCRRVVPSPHPLAIVEIDAIRTLLSTGGIVIAVGGGGIPVAVDRDGSRAGREAVIDKDLATGLLAHAVNADTILMVTGEDRVCLDYGTPDERRLDRLTVAEAQRHADAGQFPRGSMGPKIEAAIGFLTGSLHATPRVLITDIDHIPATLRGEAGTTVVR